MKRFIPILIPLALLNLASRCDPHPDAWHARDYEGCFHGHVGSICGDGPQVCTSMPFDWELGSMCSQRCNDVDDCELLEGRDVACVEDGEGAPDDERKGSGLCVLRCEADSDCPYGYVCNEGDGDQPENICHAC